jgi:hypothetical protein
LPTPPFWLATATIFAMGVLAASNGLVIGLMT